MTKYRKYAFTIAWALLLFWFGIAIGQGRSLVLYLVLTAVAVAGIIAATHTVYVEGRIDAKQETVDYFDAILRGEQP